MASRKTLVVVVAAMALVAAAAGLLPTTTAETFTVGDAAGWDIGVDYKAWACGKKFKVGDTLVFRPKHEGLNVVIVDEVRFNLCALPAKAPAHTPPQYVGRLEQAGEYFFICDAVGACKSGMKLAINVTVH